MVRSASARLELRYRSISSRDRTVIDAGALTRCCAVPDAETTTCDRDWAGREVVPCCWAEASAGTRRVAAMAAATRVRGELDTRGRVPGFAT